jgi:hypothetical protein
MHRSLPGRRVPAPLPACSSKRTARRPLRPSWRSGAGAAARRCARPQRRSLWPRRSLSSPDSPGSCPSLLASAHAYSSFRGCLDRRASPLVRMQAHRSSGPPAGGAFATVRPPRTSSRNEGPHLSSGLPRPRACPSSPRSTPGDLLQAHCTGQSVPSRYKSVFGNLTRCRRLFGPMTRRGLGD